MNVTRGGLRAALLGAAQQLWEEQQRPQEHLSEICSRIWVKRTPARVLPVAATVVGDFASNAALVLAAATGSTPGTLAEMLIKYLASQPRALQPTGSQPTGPGWHVEEAKGFL